MSVPSISVSPYINGPSSAETNAVVPPAGQPAASAPPSATTQDARLAEERVPAGTTNPATSRLQNPSWVGRWRALQLRAWGKNTVLDLVKASNQPGKFRISNKEMVRVLHNTVEEYKLPEGSSVARKIHDLITELKSGRNFFWLDQKKMSDMVRVVGEELHTLQQELIPGLLKASDAERQAPRVPTECLVQWMVNLDEWTRTCSDPQQREVVRTLLGAAKDQWEDRRLTLQNTRDYFRDVSAKCRESNLVDLADLASRLAEEMPGPEHDNFEVDKEKLLYKTRFHDNVYGRVYSSAFAAALAEDPPSGIKEASLRLGNAVVDYYMPDGVPIVVLAGNGPSIERHVRDIQADVLLDWRSWASKSQRFMAFVDEEDSEKTVIALKNLLRGPCDSGVDCMLVAYIAVRAFIRDPYAPAGWRTAANTIYSDVIVPWNQRIDNLNDMAEAMDELRKRTVEEMRSVGTPEDEIAVMNSEYRSAIETARNVMGATARRASAVGATLPFQPPVIQQGELDLHIRTADHYKPNFELRPEEHDGKSDIVMTNTAGDNKLSKAVQQALSHGIPFVGGLSGTTNMVLHFVDDANRWRGAGINPRDVLLLLIMFTGFDGGHAPDDCLAVARLLDGQGPGKLNLGLHLGDPASTNEDFVTSLKALFAVDSTNPDKFDPVKRASAKAFDQTFQYFTEHSYYANNVR